MDYFITGATGFIGRFLVGTLLERGGNVHMLVRDESRLKLRALQERYKRFPGKIHAVSGDLAEPRLGVSQDELATLKGKIDHFFHLAAIYDMKASPESQQLTNVDGTKNAIACAQALDAGCFHHMSSIAAAGFYDGVFREDMFGQAGALTHPYFQTKHESEKVVRDSCKLPWRVYRPSAVVGHSQTGEIDKIDGPYYFFSLLKKLRKALPPWAPLIGLEGGRFNVVPVDYVVDAMDHIAHLEGHDRQCFHLTDPEHHSMGALINTFADAANAPRMSLRFDTRIFNFVPQGVRYTLQTLPPIQRIKSTIFEDLGLPETVTLFLKWNTLFDNRDTERALEGSGIRVPKLSSYAPRIWDYWERNLDPDLFVDHSLEGNVRDRIVLVTGASSGIGKTTALRLAGAGATLILVARSEDKLQETQAEIEALGGTAHCYPCDIAELDSCDALVESVLANHGHVDILINNAGRSIRRSIELSFDRFHDFERTMQLNYFGALRLIMGFLPAMSTRNRGQVINISSIGVLANSPRFSAYISSKAALDAFSRCAAAELSDKNVKFTTVNMPLVRTPMISPTKIYESLPALSPEEAADLVVEAIVNKPKRVATALGIFLQIANAVVPRLVEVIMNIAYRMFPDSAAARGIPPAERVKPEISSEQAAFAAFMKGIHF